MERKVGTISRGIRCPIIREGDDLVEIAVNSVLEAAESEGYELRNRDVVALNPDWVSICIGINDVWRQFDSPAMPETHVLPQEYEKNVEAMLQKLQGKVKGIFLLSPYIIEPLREDRMRCRMDTYVSICRALAEKYGCVFVDFQQMFEDYCACRHSSYIAWDRIHPNQIGSTLMAREFLKHCDFDFYKG